MATQDGNLERSIQEIDYTKDQIDMLLATQTNDQERYELVEKIILELVNKNERLLKEKEIERRELLAMSVQQHVKIRTLEKKSGEGTLSSQQHQEHVCVHPCTEQEGKL
jgi:hypothetical protein